MPSKTGALRDIDPTTDLDNPTAKLERPVASPAGNTVFGSDVVAETLRDLEIPYIALNPGASYRGLHDSLVNHLGNRQPQMLLCLHEEHAVAIAHGYAKVTGQPMAAALHSNVGLFHGTMAIFNAWCDRMPVLVLGATGPVDAMKRRPWIDWIHTARDQGAIVRNYTKWDDQPASAGAAQEAILRGTWLARTAPKAPVYINLDAGMQEEPVEGAIRPLEPARYAPPVAMAPSPDFVREAVTRLTGARRPVILMGRASREIVGWENRIALAEALGAQVLTDLKIGTSFPTDHPLHAAPPGNFPHPDALEVLRKADVVLSLDWVDLAGTLRAAFGDKPITPLVIQVSLDHQIHNGWSMDYQALPPADIFIAAGSDLTVCAMLEALPDGQGKASKADAALREFPIPDIAGGRIAVDTMAHALRRALGERETSLLHLPLSWNGATWPFRHPLDYLGSDGGGGIGGGPGIAVGAALALRDGDSGRLPVTIGGDGDFMMGVTAIWTAVHYKIPLLYIVANNRSFYNDEVHQERVAKMRGRPVENKWIGQRISEPDVDLAGMARAQGAVAFGPITDAADLVRTFEEAIKAVEAGSVCVVDVRVEPGYTPSMTAAMTRTARE